MSSFTCPKCGKEQSIENRECIKCGVIFNKLLQNNAIKKENPPITQDTPAPEKTKKKKEKKKIVCKKCGYESTNWACPKCYTINKSVPMLAYLLVALLIGAGYAFFTPDEFEKQSTTQSRKTHIETREEKIEKHFSAWDGSHIELTKVIKASMNDPESYKHVETRYGDQGDYIIVKTTFRGKNTFGGVVTNWVTAKCDLNGKVIEITGQGP